MIAKTIIGKSFKACVNYNLAKVEKGYGEILESRGVRDYSRLAMIRDFDSRRSLNPKLSRCVWHTALSFQDKLSSSQMLTIAQQWMKRMNLDQTQFVILRHTDTDHHHVHIIANRINDQGKTVSDSNNWKRSESICGELIKEFRLSPVPEQRNESRINRDNLRGRDLLKSDINRVIGTVLRNSTSLDDFSSGMQDRGFQCLIRHNLDGTLRGISFERDGTKIKASDIHKSLAAKRIEALIQTNHMKVERLDNKVRLASDASKGSNWFISLLEHNRKPSGEDEEEEKRRRRDFGPGQIDF